MHHRTGETDRGLEPRGVGGGGVNGLIRASETNTPCYVASGRTCDAPAAVMVGVAHVGVVLL